MGKPLQSKGIDSGDAREVVTCPNVAELERRAGRAGFSERLLTSGIGAELQMVVRGAIQCDSLELRNAAGLQRGLATQLRCRQECHWRSDSGGADNIALSGLQGDAGLSCSSSDGDSAR